MDRVVSNGKFIESRKPPAATLRRWAPREELPEKLASDGSSVHKVAFSN